MILLHLGRVSDGLELRVSGASYGSSATGVSLVYGKNKGRGIRELCRTLASRGR